MVDEDGFVLVGAGLPRTGTLSTRKALQMLLNGRIYHMHETSKRPDHYPFWWKVMKGDGGGGERVTAAEWRLCLEDYRGGVDYPISNHYQSILQAYPEARVLLTVRDPVRWYISVRDSILPGVAAWRSWPVSWLIRLIDTYENSLLVAAMARHPPAWSSTGLGMFDAVEAGEEAAVRFYADHVTEVKAHVPADRLLVWQVSEGWQPLCNFLGVPVPANQPFPNVNDTQQVRQSVRALIILGWLVVVVVPGMIVTVVLLAAFLWEVRSPLPYLLMVGSYLLLLGLLRFGAQQAIKKL